MSGLVPLVESFKMCSGKVPAAPIPVPSRTYPPCLSIIKLLIDIMKIDVDEHMLSYLSSYQNFGS
jgi:hypothetical protein